VQDLDQIVSSHYSFANEGKVPLKIGHSESQKLLASDELPAAGWITKVWRKGDTLLANFADVPKKIYDLIKNKAYKRVSSELYVNMKDSINSIHKYVLRAVSLLGATIPAVKTLDDIKALYSDSDQLVICFNAEGGELMKEDFKESDMENHKEENEEVKKMSEDKIKELEKRLVEAETKATKSDADFVQMKKQFEEAQAKVEENDKKIAEAEAQKKQEENAGAVEEAIKEGSVAPSQKDFVLDVLNHFDGVKKFSENDMKDKFKALLKSNKLIFGETSKKGENSKKTLHEIAKEMETTEKISFKEALIKASKLYPDLIEVAKEIQE
jgi:hypothetical protein